MIENWFCFQERWAVLCGWVRQWVNELTMLNFTWALCFQITEQLRYPPNICSPKLHHLFLCQEMIYWKETPSLNDLDKTGCLLFLTTLIRFADDFLIYPVTAKHRPFSFYLNLLKGQRQTFHFQLFVSWMISWD